jgi:hypothetical protein
VYLFHDRMAKRLFGRHFAEPENAQIDAGMEVGSAR